MASVENLMAEGLPAPLAKQIGLEVPVTGLTASGTTQGGALALTSTFSVFSTVGSSAGCICSTDKDSFIYNGGSNALTVYPGTTAQGFGFAGLSAGTGISVPVNKGAYFMPSRGSTIAALISA